VTVQDAAAPVIISPINITVAAADGLGTPISDSAIQTFLNTANVSDDVDSELNITNDAPSVFPLGVTLVTFSAIDSTGNVGSSQSSVSVADQGKPEITLYGSTSITLSLHDTYAEPGFDALDNVDGVITDNVVVIGTIDTQVIGIYTLNYTVVDAAGNSGLVKSRQVTVQDAQAPVITVPNNIEVAAVDAFGTPSAHQVISTFLQAATVSDDIDNNLVITNNAPLIFPLGSTSVVFNAIDSIGNVGTAQALVTIVDNKPPVIYLTGEVLQTINLLDSYIEQGFSASDNVDGDITENVTATGTVDNTVVGVYTISYDVKDLANNAAITQLRHITVQDSGLLDSDEDGVIDPQDAFPLDPSESIDTDGDGIGNNADKDDDNDLTLDGEDAFPLDPSESIDTDGDGTGNNADKDDDNDGILDDEDDEPLVASIDSQAPVFSELEQVVFEATGEVTTVILPLPSVVDNSLEIPTVTSDLSDNLAIGTHLVTWTATDGTGNQSTALQTVVINDSTAPVFTTVEAITVNAKGRLTDVYYLINAIAEDIVDGDVLVTTFDNTLLPSGYHEILILAADMVGNESSATVPITIYPEASIRNTLLVESGGAYNLDVNLSGDAPHYPVAISYQLSLNGEKIETSEIAINEGTEGEVSLLVPTELQTSDNLVLNLTAADNVFVGGTSQSQLIVVEGNIAPRLSFTISQNDQLVSIVDPNKGEVTFALQINDVNFNDEHDITWTDTSGTLLNAVDVLTYHLEPSTLALGTYSFEVTVTENNTQELLSVTKSVQFVVEQLVELASSSDSDHDGISDSDEGYSDSDGDGIADYLDNDSNTTRLPSSGNTEPMNVAPGLTISLGSLVSSQGATSDQASLTLAELAQLVGDDDAKTHDEDVVAVTPLYNFTIDGLTQQGGSVAVVIPMAVDTYLPAGATYRKYNERDGWFNFVEDENNNISSARTDINGNCPAANDESYILGLTEGDNCFQLIIEDGGPNDADFIINGSVEDPGAIVVDVINHAPVVTIIAAEDEYAESSSVSLTAQASDEDGDEMTYLWQQISGPEVVFDDVTLATVNLSLPEVVSDELIEIQVTVSDGRLSTANTTSFKVVSLIDTKSRNAGATFWLLILLVLVRMKKAKTYPKAF